jgi:hypothetical protein
LPVGLPCRYRSSRATGNTPRHRGQRIGRRGPCNGPRCLQLGHTTYHSPQLAGKWTAFVGRGTMVHRRGSVSTRSMTDRGTVTERRLTSRTTSSGESLLIRYHAPRRSGYGPSALRRAHRKSIMGGPGLSCRMLCPLCCTDPTPWRVRSAELLQVETGSSLPHIRACRPASAAFTRAPVSGGPQGPRQLAIASRHTAYFGPQLGGGPARCRPSVVDRLIGGGPEIETHADYTSTKR